MQQSLTAWKAHRETIRAMLADSRKRARGRGAD
jgi:hypothetical protein